MANRITVGAEFNHNFSFSQKDVVAFAQATGDKNPLHLDEEYATTTIFKRPIIHGFLGGSIFSKVFGTIFPGKGTIYLKQELSFLRPMFVEVNYTAKFKVLETYENKNRALVETTIEDANKNLVLTGKALIQHDEIR